MVETSRRANDDRRAVGEGQPREGRSSLRCPTHPSEAVDGPRGCDDDDDDDDEEDDGEDAMT